MPRLRGVDYRRYNNNDRDGQFYGRGFTLESTRPFTSPQQHRYPRLSPLDQSNSTATLPLAPRSFPRRRGVVPGREWDPGRGERRRGDRGVLSSSRRGTVLCRVKGARVLRYRHGQLAAKTSAEQRLSISIRLAQHCFTL